MLILLVGGIAMAQGISDPQQVTLRWLRLGGIIAVALLGVAAVVVPVSPQNQWTWAGLGITAAFVIAQLMTVQKGWRKPQRLLALAGWISASVAAAVMILALAAQAPPLVDPAWVDLADNPPPAPAASLWQAVPAAMASAGLLGGSLMTMLLGHAYLTAGGEMTQKPLLRLVRALEVLLLVRLAMSLLFGLLPYTDVAQSGLASAWPTALITVRVIVGLVVPAVLAYMIDDCVRRVANQSATGILYVACVLLILGEGSALALIGATALIF